MIYNTKITSFANGNVQVRFYTKDIHVKDELVEQIQKKRLKSLDNTDSVLTDPDLLLYQSKNRTIQNLYAIARSNVWDYFVTFTFNKDRVNRQSYEDCYNAVSRYVKWLKKKYCPNLKYLLVPELHSDGVSFHFHGLFANCLDIPLVVATKDGKELLDEKGRYIYNAPDYIYGFSTFTRIDDNFAVISYMTKYITKDLVDNTIGYNRYICSKDIARPVCKVAKLSQEQLEDLFSRSGVSINYCKTIGEEDNKLSIFEIDSVNEFFDGFVSNFIDWDFL